MTAVTTPALTSVRLTRRATKLADVEHRAAFFAAARSIHGRGMKPRAEAWRARAADVANGFLRGYRPFGDDARATGACIGEVGFHEPDGHRDPGLGRCGVPGAQGKGFAGEAARAVMVWTRESLGRTRLVSILDPDNTRSIALGRRLGGGIDPDAEGDNPGDVVIVRSLGGAP